VFNCPVCVPANELLPFIKHVFLWEGLTNIKQRNILKALANIKQKNKLKALANIKRVCSIMGRRNRKLFS